MIPRWFIVTVVFFFPSLVSAFSVLRPNKPSGDTAFRVGSTAAFQNHDCSRQLATYMKGSIGEEKRQGFLKLNRRTRGSARQRRRGTSTMLNGSASTPEPLKRRNWGRYVLTRFVQLLFKGMTLPFPMLRELAGVKETTEDEGAVVGFSLLECAYAIVCYLGLGILAYSVLLERWSITDALYFSVVTFTSVGYGDLSPTTVAGKLFTCFFGFAGLAFLGAAVSTIGSSLLQAEQQVIEAAEEVSRTRVMGLFEGMPAVVKQLRGNHTKSSAAMNTTSTSVEEEEDEPTVLETVLEIEKDDESTIPAWKAHVRKTAARFVPASTFLFFGGALMGLIEGWTLVDAMYYSIITAGTIGYGDYAPQSRRGRLWGILFIPLAVAAAGDLLGNIASSLMERRQQRLYDTLVNREMSVDTLLAMDADNNGNVSREEYVQYMLVEMELVDAEQFEELHAQFDRLDVDGGGYLDKEDLRLMAEQRGVKAN